MKLFSKKTGELAIVSTLPPNLHYLHIPGSTCCFASASFGHLMIQEIKLEALTIRYTDIIPAAKVIPDEILLIEENTSPVLQVSLQGSQYFQLQDLGHISFHERSFNIHVPPPVVTMDIRSMLPSSYVQVFIHWTLAENISGTHPQLYQLMYKYRHGKSAMLTRYHQVASWKMIDTIERIRNEKFISVRDDLSAYLLLAAFKIADQEPIIKKGVLTDEDISMIYSIKNKMLSNLEVNFTKDELLKEYPGLKKYKFEKGFHEVFGKSAFALLTEQRMKLAADLLDDERRLTIVEIASETGYKDPSPFVKAFYRFFGLYPEAFRQHKKKQSHLSIPRLS